MPGVDGEPEPQELRRGAGDGEEEEEDYMGDLSLFLPSSELPTTTSNTKKAQAVQPDRKSKRRKSLSWQEQRRIERERKQKAEDDMTKSNMETQIPSSNLGFKMLKMMGYSPGSALGKEGKGVVDPVGLDIRRSRAGIGRESETELRARREKELEGKWKDMEERKRRRVDGLLEEFGTRQKAQWRGRRVLWDYNKAEAALAQLENRVVSEIEKKDGEDDKVDQDEEEVEITEEDLQRVLIKLREDHLYCLYCGCQTHLKQAALESMRMITRNIDVSLEVVQCFSNSLRYDDLPTYFPSCSCHLFFKHL